MPGSQPNEAVRLLHAEDFSGNRKSMSPLRLIAAPSLMTTLARRLLRNAHPRPVPDALDRARSRAVRCEGRELRVVLDVARRDRRS